MDETEAAAAVERAEEALARLQGLTAPGASAGLEAVGALVAVYGEGLARLVSMVVDRAPALVDALGGDVLVTHLLLLHGLHPDPLERRVERALDEVRPQLRAQGGDVELRGVDGGVARLRLSGLPPGAAGTPGTARDAVVEALDRWAPELEVIDVLEASPAETLVPAGSLFRPPSSVAAERRP